MTDKEKLKAIRAEVQNYIDAAHKAHANITEGNFAYLLSFIDSLQEEPVSIWHDASEKSNEPEDVIIINPSDNTGEVLTRCINVYQGRIWAYTSVLLNLDNLCKIGKNLQEHISEELEEVSKEWLRPQLDKSYVNYGEVKMMELTHFDGYAMLDAIEFGAKWKEQQMMSKAIVREVKVDAGGYPYIDATELYDYDKDMPLAKEWNKVKIIVIKED